MAAFNSRGQKDQKVSATPRRKDRGARVQCHNVHSDVTTCEGDREEGDTSLGNAGSESLLPAAPGLCKGCCSLITPLATNRGIWKITFGKLLSIIVWERGPSRPPTTVPPSNIQRTQGSHRPLLQPFLGVSIWGFLLTTPAMCG